MTKIILFPVLLLFCTSPTRAQPGKIDTDRPDQTESAVIVPRHYIQGEFGFNKENLSGENYDLVHPTVLLKYGLHRFEFRLEATYRSSYMQFIPNPRWVRGLDPIEIGFKAALWEEKKWIPKTSVIFHFAIPGLSSPAFRPAHGAPSFRFTMQNSLTDNIGIGYNLGAEWDGEEPSPYWLYTFAPGFNLGEKWYGYVEAFGFIRKNETPQNSLDAGLAYYISNDLKLDVSGGFGISKAAPKSYFALGFSFRCNTKNKKVSSSSTHSGKFVQN